MKRSVTFFVSLGWALIASASPAALENCRGLAHHGKRAEARACFAALERSDDPFLRAEGAWGLQKFDAANEQFKLAYNVDRNQAEVRTEWGLLFLERFNSADAEGLFKEALQVDPKYTLAYVGLARTAAGNYDERAVALANTAEAMDSKRPEPHELLAFLALEDNDEKKATIEANAALAVSNESLDAMAVLASIDWLHGRADSRWPERIQRVNPIYGEAYSMGAHFMEINRRYEEAVKLYRLAIALDPDLWQAHSELGMNLLRLGDYTEGKQHLELAYENHYRNAVTANAMKFLDQLPKYKTYPGPHSVLFLQQKEAALLKPYIQPELERAIAAYEVKYKFKLPGPVRLEVYPDHDDFIVRTLGLPGQGGLLGVTFGLVVAMDSPSAREPGAFNWASTMWHELSHVYVVTMTNHLVPRWFTEGVSVHEETAAGSPEWGDRLTPDIVQAIQQKKLLPVLDLDRGFVRPVFPEQVIVSYYEAGQICDYIADKYGNDAILGMIHSYAASKTTAEAIRENLHLEPLAFDKEFFAWLDTKTEPTVKNFEAWQKGMKELHEKKTGDPEHAIALAEEMKKLYPDYVEPGSTYEVLAELQEAQGNKAGAQAQLEQYLTRGGHALKPLKKLAELQQQMGDTKAAAATYAKIEFIYLEDRDVLRNLGTLELDAGNSAGAVREFEAVLALNPGDQAESHYNLARALAKSGQKDQARDEVMSALEAAPNYKQAQRLLLDLSR